MHSNHSTKTSHTLLDAIAKHGQQDEIAWKRFTRLYTPLVYSWCRGLNCNPNDVHDIGQDVMLAVLNGIETFDPTQKSSGAFRSWLWGVTRNKVRDHARHRIKVQSAQGGTDFQSILKQVPEDAAEPETVEGLSPSRFMLESAFEMMKKEFDERTWVCFWKMAVDGLKAREIGSELEMTAKAVRQAKFRVAKKLRELLAEDFPELYEQFKAQTKVQTS